MRGRGKKKGEKRGKKQAYDLVPVIPFEGKKLASFSSLHSAWNEDDWKKKWEKKKEMGSTPVS